MMAYLAGPLDDVSHEDGRAWYDEIERLSPPGWVLYCPGMAFRNPASDPLYADAANRAVILKSSVVIANLTGEGRGFGTIREIEFARAAGRPVVVVGEVVSLLAHDCVVVQSLEDVWPEIVRQVDQAMEQARALKLSALFGIGDEDA